MVQDAVAQVVEAETAAQEQIAAARIEAERIITEAEEQAAELVAAARAEAEDGVRKQVARGRREAEAERDRLLADSRQQAEQLAASGRQRLTAAALLIRERIVQSYGRS